MCSKEAGRTTGRATRTATDKYYIIYSKDCNNEGLRKLKIDHRSIDRSYTCTSSSMCIWYHFTATYQQHIHACPLITIIIFMHTYPLSTDIRYIHTHTHMYDTALHLLSCSNLRYLREFPLVQTTGKAINYTSPYTAAHLSALPPKNFTQCHAHASTHKHTKVKVCYAHIWGTTPHTHTYGAIYVILCPMGN